MPVSNKLIYRYRKGRTNFYRLEGIPLLIFQLFRSEQARHYFAPCATPASEQDKIIRQHVFVSKYSISALGLTSSSSFDGSDGIQ